MDRPASRSVAAPRGRAWHALILLIGVLVGAGPARGQSCDRPEPQIGDRVRVTLRVADPGVPGPVAASGGPVVEGTLLRLDPAMLEVDAGWRIFDILPGDVARLEVQCIGPDPIRTGTAAIGGGLIGAVVVGAIVACSHEGTEDRRRCHPDNATNDVVKGAALGAVAGVGIGLLVGLADGESTWVDVEVAAGPDGRWTVGLSVPVGPG